MKCENCNIKHNGTYGSGRFCSEKCAHSYPWKIKRKEMCKNISLAMGGTGDPGQGITKICKHCNTTFTSKQCKQSFCSTLCSNLYKTKETQKKLDYIQNFAGYGINTIKKYLISRKKHKCEICGTEVWNGKPVPLVMDHIDGNSDNWDVTNLRLVCRNCDGQLDTFCGKNKGYGASRSKRKMKKYYDGQTF
jgi:hypothetical protein